MPSLFHADLLSNKYGIVKVSHKKLYKQMHICPCRLVFALISNNAVSDEMSLYAAFYLGLHCLLKNPLFTGIYDHKRDKQTNVENILIVLLALLIKNSELFINNKKAVSSNLTRLLKRLAKQQQIIDGLHREY